MSKPNLSTVNTLSSSDSSEANGKTVCVIGLGPAGLVAVKELKQAGFEVTAFDPWERIGGRWSLDPKYESGVWNELCFNGTRRNCGYSDFPWNKEDFSMDLTEKDRHGLFPHNTEARAYLEAYAKHFNLANCFKLRTTVVSVAPSSPKERGQKSSWNVKTNCNGEETEHTFDFVIACPGRQAVGRNPLANGVLKGFTGRVMHSSELKSIHDFENERVLVVGASVSGSDISSELARKGKCAKVVNSVRRVPYHVDRLCPKSQISIDSTLFKRLPVWLGRYLPDRIVYEGFKKEMLENYPHQLTPSMTGGLAPEANILKAGVGVASGYVESIEQKKLTLKLSIASSNDRKVTFQDGSEEEFDTIICATGYDTNLSFFDDAVLNTIQYTSPFTKAKEVALYKHTLVHGYENLALFGIFNGIGPIYQAFEMQARYVAAIWSGKLKRPSRHAIRQGIQDFKEYRERGSHNSTELSVKVSEDLADELGLSPSVWEAMANPKELLLGPLYACYYRKDDADKIVAKQARERLKYFSEHPDKAERVDS